MPVPQAGAQRQQPGVSGEVQGSLHRGDDGSWVAKDEEEFARLCVMGRARKVEVKGRPLRPWFHFKHSKKKVCTLNISDKRVLSHKG